MNDTFRRNTLLPYSGSKNQSTKNLKKKQVKNIRIQYKVVYSSETSVDIKCTDRILHSHYCENLNLHHMHQKPEPVGSTLRAKPRSLAGRNNIPVSASSPKPPRPTLFAVAILAYWCFVTALFPSPRMQNSQHKGSADEKDEKTRGS
jgi:hypothetical protein